MAHPSSSPPMTPSETSAINHSGRYRGRFAPSPSGALHFGSLVSALASFLDAKAHQGAWLVRMEDLDPPREQAGAADSILSALEAHHLYWDEPVLYQSQRLNEYSAYLDTLSPHCYHCICTRHRLVELEGVYDGLCRDRSADNNTPSAIRLRTDHLGSDQLDNLTVFQDIFLGEQYLPMAASGDFIIRRKDGLFAYQLAVAVDDHFQGISHVVRGADLLDSTNRQRYLLQLLGVTTPAYGHTPLVMLDQHNKLSKQTGAEPINTDRAFENLYRAMVFLAHSPPGDIVKSNEIDVLLDWGIRHWQREQVPKHPALAPDLTRL